MEARQEGGGETCGRECLQDALVEFERQLREFVTGSDERKFSKAALRRARGIEAQLGGACESVLADLLPVVSADDLHAVWTGFTLIRNWRDSRVPQDCLLKMLNGLLDKVDDEWTEQALTWELTLPEVHQAISVSAWPALCEMLGRLPDEVTATELQEALWHQSFVENPTNAPDHRNYKRFALLAAQMVAIGVELQSEKVELLVQHTLEMDRPWRERRDMLTGILTAASVEDRQKIVRGLDRRFEEHADIDDFEIVCGIAEHVGVEIPRHGAIRRCALRRWALDPKRGGALAVARLIDFVEGVSIGEDVARDLRSRGRVADAALLLSRLPGAPAGALDTANGDAELARLRVILAQDVDNEGEFGLFGPVEEGAVKLPPECDVVVNATAEGAKLAAERLVGSVMGLQLWKEEAPFWYSPVIMLAASTDCSVEIFDLVTLRSENPAQWAEAANTIRAKLADPHILKVAYSEDTLHQWASALMLGIANTLKRDREPLGPVVDLRGVVADALGGPARYPDVVRRFLGLRLCPEEAHGNWARRALRPSQVHHAACDCWMLVILIRCLCFHGICPAGVVKKHLCIATKVKSTGRRKCTRSTAPRAARAAEVEAEAERERERRPPTRMAMLGTDVAPSSCGTRLRAGSLVEVVDERLNTGYAIVVPVGTEERRTIPSSVLIPFNGWDCPAWVASLPRPEEVSEAEVWPAGGGDSVRVELAGELVAQLFAISVERSLKLLFDTQREEMKKK